jgi:CRISPR-associated protein Cas5d
MSYLVPTPSAARGILEAILWKPAIHWRIERIKVLAPIRLTAFRRNEVNSRAATPSAALVRDGGSPPVLFADEDRSQRNTVALCDVDYIIEARIDMTDRAGPPDNLAKFVDMFRRRVEKGQRFHQPYLGCRDFAADIRPVDESTPPPIGDSRGLGLMIWVIAFSPQGNRPVFYAARLDKGVLEVPSDEASAIQSIHSAALSGEGGGAA